MKLHVVFCALLASAVVAASPMAKAESRSDSPVMRQMQESYEAVRGYRESLSPRQRYMLDSTNNWLDANYPNKMVPINKKSVAYVAREVGGGDPADLVIIHATLRDHNQFLINADKVERALRSPYYSGGCLPGDADYPACLDNY
jgi:hypothetical protein